MLPDDDATTAVQSAPIPLTFIVSTGRCGSTLISRMLRLHPEVLSLSETLITLGPEALAEDVCTGAQAWDRVFARPPPDIARGLARGIRTPELLAPSVTEATPPLMLVTLPHLGGSIEVIHEHLRDHMRSRGNAPLFVHVEAAFAWLLQAYDKRFCVERSGGSLEFVERLHGLWPRARFLHLFRAGPPTALSMSRHAFFQQLLVEAAANRASSHAKKRGSPDLRSFGLYWSRQILRGLDALREIEPDHVLHVCFESVIAQPQMELRRVISFIGGQGAVSDSWLESASELVGTGSSEENAAADDRAHDLDRACRPGMRALSALVDEEACSVPEGWGGGGAVDESQ